MSAPNDVTDIPEHESKKRPKHQLDDLGDTRIDQKCIKLYYYVSHEALYQMVDIHAIETEWVQIASLRNDTDENVTFECTRTTKLTFTSNQEISNTWGIGAAFKDLSIVFGGERKSFLQKETSSETSSTLSTNIAPRKALFIYQRVFRFRTIIWFKLDAWGEDWAVGHRGSDNLLTTDSAEQEIWSDDLTLTDKSLSGKDSKHTQENPYQRNIPRIRKFENCTSLCKKLLLDKGLSP